MTVIVQPEPVGGRNLVNAELARRAHRARDIAPLRGAPRTTGPLPVYLLVPEDMTRPDPLSAATMIGWRYLIVDGDEPGIAQVSRRDSRLEFAGISYGSLAQRLVDALALADQSLSSRPETFQMRLLEVPAARMLMVWLSSPASFFISLLDGQPPGSAPLRIETTSDIIARIRANLPTQRPRQLVGGPPTN